MGWFAPFTVAADLADVLDCRYVAQSAGHHDLLPDGAMDLVWTHDKGIMLCGPDTVGWSFDREIGRPMAGVRFRPGAAGAVFGVAAYELVDRRVRLDDVMGGRQDRVLCERLEEAGSDGARMALVESFVRRHRTEVDPTAELAALVVADPSIGVDALAAETGVSARQLRRRFAGAVGYGPAFFARIARLQRFARTAMRRPGPGLAELAAAAGYADHSHLAKDTRHIAGCTPAALVAALPGSSVAVDVGPADVRSVQDSDRPTGSRWAA